MFEVSNLDKNINNEPMLDMFIFETEQLTEQLEQIILGTEKSKSFDFDDINEIFRIMHTIKGSSAMMLFNNISILAHSIEDVFYFLREKKEAQFDKKVVIDLILESVDFIKTELSKISGGYSSDGDSSDIIEKIRNCLKEIKENNDCPPGPVTLKDDKNQKYYIGSYKLRGIKTEKNYDIFILFEEGCGMENIQAFSIIHSLKEHAVISSFYPPDVMDDDSSPEYIKNNGFHISIKTDLSTSELHAVLIQSVFVKEIEIHEVEEQPQRRSKEIILDEEEKAKPVKPDDGTKDSDSRSNQLKQSFISVSLQKLDKLLDLVGELVISESMVTRNPEIEKLEIESFNKASRQLRKISSELQDMVMSIRMVPVASTFQKMNRIVRDMSNKLSKEVSLEIIGEETEVDKNIIETVSDPLMHLIRNSLDHGIESPEERAESGKERAGKIVLEAGNLGGDIFISVRDDGRGLDRARILEKAKKQGLMTKPENELSDKEINSFIFMPGFSTKESVSEFSGRGVGMDVV
ncbi:MAG TPA: Hpt domain-containing protein, partial [Clostridia bacterium]